MDHKPDIGLVNPHAKRICRNDHLHSVVNKILLIFLPCLIVNSRMIPCHRNAVPGKLLVQHIHIFAGCTIDNSALIRMIFEIFYHKIILVPPRDMLHAVIQIFPVKTRDDDARIPQLEDALNIVLNLLCGSRCKCTHNRADRQPVYKFNNFQIARSEILPPL